MARLFLIISIRESAKVMCRGLLACFFIALRCTDFGNSSRTLTVDFVSVSSLVSLFWPVMSLMCLLCVCLMYQSKTNVSIRANNFETKFFIIYDYE